MSMDWQTEEEVVLGERLTTRRPSPRTLTVIAALLLVVIPFVLVWAMNGRVNRETKQIESDILSVYKVVEHAAGDEDVELFVYFLSAAKPLWRDAWAQVVGEGAYHERSAFGLQWLPVGNPSTSVSEIALNPELNTAELVTEQAYSIDIGNGFTETIRLQQTAVFRHEQERWLLSPPNEAFWGATQVITKTFITLQFPERDRILAHRLATDLNDLLVAMCAKPISTCPTDFILDVAFKTDPATLSTNYRSLVYVGGNWSTRLPTPTLAGMPRDETGYQALRRGYGIRLLNPVLRQLTGMPANLHTPFFDAWIDWQCQALGLRPPPLSTADWQNLALQEIPLSAGQEYFIVSGTANPLSHAIILFLIEEIGVMPEEIKQSFTSGGFLPYEDWLVDLTGNQYDMIELEKRWQAFIEIQAHSRGLRIVD
jgi:hypothetical protein